MIELAQLSRFFSAGNALCRILETEGASAVRNPEHREIVAELMESAPAEMKAITNDIAAKSGLFPEATMVDVTGGAVYSIEEVSKQLGISVEEVVELLKDSPEDCTYSGPTTAPK